MLRVYIAGRMGGRLGQAVMDERSHAAALCEAWGLESYDPALGEDIFPDKLVDLAMPYEKMKQFVSKDEFAIRHCDVMLILTADNPSEGTGLEFGLALSLGMPVVAVGPKRAKGEIMGFWSIKADAIFATVEEAVEFISMTYGG